MTRAAARWASGVEGMRQWVEGGSARQRGGVKEEGGGAAARLGDTAGDGLRVNTPFMESTFQVVPVLMAAAARAVPW